MCKLAPFHIESSILTLFFYQVESKTFQSLSHHDVTITAFAQHYYPHVIIALLFITAPPCHNNSFCWTLLPPCHNNTPQNGMVSDSNEIWQDGREYGEFYEKNYCNTSPWLEHLLGGSQSFVTITILSTPMSHQRIIKHVEVCWFVLGFCWFVLKSIVSSINEKVCAGLC